MVAGAQTVRPGAAEPARLSAWWRDQTGIICLVARPDRPFFSFPSRTSPLAGGIGQQWLRPIRRGLCSLRHLRRRPLRPRATAAGSSGCCRSWATKRCDVQDYRDGNLRLVSTQAGLRCSGFVCAVERQDIARMHARSNGSTLHGAVSYRCGPAIRFLPRKTKFVRHIVWAIMAARFLFCGNSSSLDTFHTSLKRRPVWEPGGLQLRQIW
jgi:hypothetical protein